MKTFVFIIPRTPVEYRSDLREKLFEISILSLKKQLSVQWEALVISDENREDGNIIYLKSDAVKKGDKIDAAMEYISLEDIKPEYLIRFDDDDIISPFALKEAEKKDFDCLGDRYHAFINVVDARISLQKRNWLANTVIHKYEHAVEMVDGLQHPLINTDHSEEWLKYYKKRKLKYTHKKKPLYLRVLSPTSTEFGDIKTGSTSFKYDNFIKSHGKWKYSTLKGFDAYIDMINGIKK